MSSLTKIEWATSTGNPWIGCTKVSPGCKNCYAETLDRQRFSRTMGGGTKLNPVSHWGPGAPRYRTKTFWKHALRWNDQINSQHEIGNIPPRPRIFPSLCDWLDDEVPIEWLADFLKLIHDTPNLDWLLLTKRPELFFDRLIATGSYLNGTDLKSGTRDGETADFIEGWIQQQPPANVWLGVSVEDQPRADERIPALLKIPANLRFLSVEPLLGPVRLTSVCGLSFNRNPDHTLAREDGDGIDWIIVGGESGPGARPCNIEWITSVIRQCQAAGVPCFVKQLGSDPRRDYEGEMVALSGPLSGACKVRIKDGPLKLKHKKGGDPAEWPEALRLRQFPAERGCVAETSRSSS
jgi:protein gp37